MHKSPILFQHVAFIFILYIFLLQSLFYLKVMLSEITSSRILILKFDLHMLMVVACIVWTLLRSASTTLFSLHLMCLIYKSNSDKNSNHLVFLAFKVYCSNIYFIPLWYVLNLNFLLVGSCLHIFNPCTIKENSKSCVA